jgi:hypothetical protein
LRAPEAVARDVWNEKVSERAARERYGVAVNPDGKIDAPKTALMRSK